MNIVTQGDNTNITLPQGETEPLPFSLTDSSTGNLVDLTGYLLKMQIQFPTPVLLTSANGGISITGIGVGHFNFTESLTYPTGVYPYDVWMTSGSGVSDRMFAGRFSVPHRVTPLP